MNGSVETNNGSGKFSLEEVDCLMIIVTNIQCACGVPGSKMSHGLIQCLVALAGAKREMPSAPRLVRGACLTVRMCVFCGERRL